MININLTNNRGYHWSSYNELKLKGYIFLENTMFSTFDLYEYIKNNESDLFGAIERLSGCFSFIYEKKDGTVLIVTDKIGLFPIYYEQKDKDIFIFDDPNNNHSKKLNYRALERFPFLGSTEKNDTLLENVNVTLPSTVMLIENNHITLNKYFHWSKGKGNLRFDGVLFKDVITKCIERLIRFANGRRIVLPLSGGHDSRLIAYFLHEAGYKNVITFTYGNKNCQDVYSSRKIAEYLGYDWRFVEYKKEILRKYYYSKDYLELSNYLSNAFTIPHIQDWVAIKELLNEGYIKQEDIIVPGHSGDTMCGSTISEDMTNRDFYTPEYYCAIIEKTFYRLNQSKNKKTRKMLLDGISAPFKGNINSDEFIHHVEDYNLNERHSRVYAHAIKMYEFFNLQWYLPLWDNDFILYWRGVCWQDRINRNKFVDFAFGEYKELFDIAPIADHPFWKTHKNKLVNLLAKVGRIRKNYHSNPINYYYYLTYFDYLKYVLFHRTSSYYYMFGKRFINLLKKGKIYELD